MRRRRRRIRNVDGYVDDGYDDGDDGYEHLL